MTVLVISNSKLLEYSLQLEGYCAIQPLISGFKSHNYIKDSLKSSELFFSGKYLVKLPLISWNKKGVRSDMTQCTV